jgi:hypothetical protein
MKLTREQIDSVVVAEIEYQLTIMKQYLSKEETNAYLLLLNRYGSLLEQEAIIQRYQEAWGETLDDI